MSNEFKKAFIGIGSAIQQGTVRALNRALSSTKTELVKNLGADTGLKAALIKTRVLDIKANKNKFSVQLAIATKVGVSLAEFSPREKVVNVVHPGHTLPTRHVGVTVAVGGNRDLVPGGFLWTAPSGKQLVLARKSTTKYPVVTLRSNAFTDAAQARVAETESTLRSNFEDQVVAQVEYAVQAKFDSDK